MTIDRTIYLNLLATIVAAAVLLTAPGAVPIARADAFSQMTVDSEWKPPALAGSSDVKSGTAPPETTVSKTSFMAAIVYLLTRPVQSSQTLGWTTKSLPNYGSIAPIAGAVGSGHCVGSSGTAFHPSGRMVFVSGGIGSPGRLCGFLIDPVTRAWTPVTPAGATPVATGTLPGAVAIDPAGHFVYVPGGSSSGTVTGFAIDQATGVPTPLPGSPFSTGGSFPHPAVIDRTGRYLYVGQSLDGFNGSIAVFAIDAETGALTPVPGSPFPHFENFGAVRALALAPDGRFLFAAGTGIGTYALNPTTGVPSRVAITGSGNYQGLTVEPTGRFAYAPEYFSSVVHGFSIAADGKLAQVGTPQAIGSVSRAITSAADLVYVASSGTDSIYGFRINPATGTLVPVAGSPFGGVSWLPNALAAMINLPPAMQVDAGDNVVARVGTYGGRPPYTWSIVDGALPPGIVLNATTGIVSGTANAPGNHSFTIGATDRLGASASAAKSITVLGSAAPTPVAIIEFYNAALDHYFITYVTDEIAKLDNGTFKGWARTGLSFNAWATTQSGTSAVCRIYIPPGKGDGHFFGRDTNECDGTMAKNPTFILESGTFFYLYPPTLGNCAAGQIPVYRVFSNRADANHRYTTSRTVRDQMVAKGWLAEGDGADTVVMCAPA